MTRAVEQHLTVDEVAGRLAVHHQTVRRAIDQGTRTRGRAGIWPTVRLGRTIRIPESAVARFLGRSVDGGASDA